MDQQHNLTKRYIHQIVSQLHRYEVSERWKKSEISIYQYKIIDEIQNAQIDSKIDT